MRDFYPQGFVPLSSAPSLQAQPSLMEEFLMRAAPRVYANQVKVDQSGKPFTDTSRLIPVLRVTFPVPCPAAVLLHAKVADSSRFARRSSLSAEVINKGPAMGSEGAGRFVVEWGSGEARGYLFTDLADGSVQLPSTIEVSVYAYVESGGSHHASAVVMPCVALPDPHATFTSDVITTGEDEFGIARQPFARAMTATFAATGSGDANVPVQLDVLTRRVDSVVGHWVLPDPSEMAVVSAPGPLVELPLGGGVDNFRMAFSGLPSPPDGGDDDPRVGALLGVGSLVQTIKV